MARTRTATAMIPLLAFVFATLVVAASSLLAPQSATAAQEKPGGSATPFDAPASAPDNEPAGAPAYALASAPASAPAYASVNAAASTSNLTAQAATPTLSAKQKAAFKRASADFALDLFRRSVAARGKNANVTISPMSVLNALAMATNGAAGKAGAQLRAAIAGGASTAALNKSLKWYSSKLVNTAKARLSNANAIWYHDKGTLKIKKKFIATNKKYLGAGAQPADFSDPSTVNAINAWVSRNTNGMIKRLVSRVTPDMRLILANAVYFDAEWKVPYEKSDVRTRAFTTANGQKRKVKMMFSTESRYIEAKGVTGFIRPYAKGYSYVALLPKKGTAIKAFLSDLDGTAFRKLVAGAQRATVRAGIPKYSVAYTNENMRTQLAGMGIRLAFDPFKADFSNMATDKTGNLFIDQVIHKTKVEIDERGTKAAAVTGIVYKNTSFTPVKVKTVVLNRPFVYAIVDNATKLPVFIGAVNNIGS